MNKIHLHQGDVPSDIVWGAAISVDTETMGLNPFRDRLCIVQIAAESGDIHLVQFPVGKPYKAPNLQKLMKDPKILKIFHFARFDVGFIYKDLDVIPRPVYCTKIASKLTRTYTDRHGLKDLVKELLNVTLEKEQQCSDWGSEILTQQQMEYAAKDVLYLHQLRTVLDERLKREKRLEVAYACFEFIPYRAALDLLGMDKEDIFAH
jgi:ribonuclease D